MRRGFILLAAMIACSGSRARPDPAETDTRDLEQLIRQRKLATAHGDSLAWLRAASLHSDATCADAGGALRRCRPDLAGGSEWRLGISVDSVRTTMIDSIAVVTYQQTDTVHVGLGVLTSGFRYVETYRRHEGRWELLASAEIPIRPERHVVPIASALIQPYLGGYASGAYTFTVSRRGEALLIAAPSGPPDTLWASSAATFFVRGDPAEYVFVQSGRKPATELIYRTNGQALHFVRTER